MHPAIHTNTPAQSLSPSMRFAFSKTVPTRLFVSMSAKLLADSIYLTRICPEEISIFVKWNLKSICFPFLRLFSVAHAIDPWLSLYIKVGICPWHTPNSRSKLRSQTISLDHSISAMYSASQLETAMEFCLRDFHQTVFAPS